MKFKIKEEDAKRLIDNLTLHIWPVVAPLKTPKVRYIKYP